MFWECNIAVYNKKYVWYSSPFLAQSSPNPRNLPSAKSYKGASSYVNEMTFGHHVRKRVLVASPNVIRVLELSCLHLPYMGPERGWRLSQLPMANN